MAAMTAPTSLYLTAAAVAVLSAISVRCVRAFALKKALLDMPNDRSSHKVPVPRLGGAAFIPVVLLGLAAAWWRGGPPMRFISTSASSSRAGARDVGLRRLGGSRRGARGLRRARYVHRLGRFGRSRGSALPRTLALDPRRGGQSEARDLISSRGAADDAAP